MPRTLDKPAHAGERIRAFRRLTGVSQVELAKALGLTQGQISHIESGRRDTTAEFLARVTEVTSFPRSFFDPAPTALPPMSLRFRRMATARAGDVHQSEQLVTEAYRALWQLLRNRDGYIPPTLPVATTPELRPGEIEDLASQARGALGLDARSPVPHVTRRLERAGIVVTPLSLTASDDTGPDSVGHFGVSCWPGTPEPAVVGYFEGGSGDRQRFTLAHELGHLVLHTSRDRIDDPESEANRFAGAFLVPRTPMTELASSTTTLRDFARLKATWGVSIQALIMRANQTGAITGERKTSLFKQLAARGWRRNEPVVVHHESPVLFAKLLASLFGTGAAGYRRAEQALGLPALILANLAPNP